MRKFIFLLFFVLFIFLGMCALESLLELEFFYAVRNSYCFPIGVRYENTLTTPTIENFNFRGMSEAEYQFYTKASFIDVHAGIHDERYITWLDELFVILYKRELWYREVILEIPELHIYLTRKAFIGMIMYVCFAIPCFYIFYIELFQFL